MADRPGPFTALALLCAALPLPVAAQTVGINAAVVNDVRMTTQANPALHKAVVKERVSLGNDIQTGRASVLQVLFLDRTSLTVGGNARIKVDRFVYDPNRKASAIGLSVTKGAFRFMSGKALHANPGQSAIRTPVASIGIRGTIVEGAVGPDAMRIAAQEAGVPGGYRADPETASLILLRGPGATTGESSGAIDITVGGAMIPIETPGLALFVPASGQAPIGPFRLSDAGSAMLAALLQAQRGGLPAGENPLVSNPIVDQVFQRGGAGQPGRDQIPGPSPVKIP